MYTAATQPASTIRSSIRTAEWTGPTAEVGRGWTQANLLAVPAHAALAFATFCRRNARACPLLDVTDPGDPCPPLAAAGADLRTDLPRYRVYRDGALVTETTSVERLWRDDLVAFLLGCSFTFEQALIDAGIRLRHIDEGANVAMYRTAVPCRPSGPFRGNVVISMRPIPRERVDEVVSICSSFAAAHGAPIAVGDPARLGIADLSRPDFGDAVAILPDEEPVFWACGVTAAEAARNAELDLFIAHAPGHMFITDWPYEVVRDEGFLVGDGFGT
jgi:uncharacterized protein YcsI (UPF0317 family)